MCTRNSLSLTPFECCASNQSTGHVQKHGFQLRTMPIQAFPSNKHISHHKYFHMGYKPKGGNFPCSFKPGIHYGRYTVPSGKYSYTLTFSKCIKCIKSIFPVINLHTIPHNDKVKICFYNFLQVYKAKKKITFTYSKYLDRLLSTLLKELWQRLQPRVFLGMTRQA
jgi:hypothetical protein